MITSEFESLIIKFLSHSADQQELEALEAWIQNPENQVIFKEYVKTNYALVLGANDPDSSHIRKRLLEKLRAQQRKENKSSGFPFFLKYAAILVLALGLFYFLGQEFLNSSNTIAIVPKREAITLELDNGEVVLIPENGTSNITNAKGRIIGLQQGEQLSYDHTSVEKELHYNTLNVPFGRRFNLTLSDGTKVFLNAGSSIRYPTEFIPGKKRQVFLKGEAYFDVSHNDNPFEVWLNPLTVEVYGTQFNVSNYPEDSDAEIVLLKGSVGLTSVDNQDTQAKQDQIVLLKPGFKGAFNKADKLIRTQKVDTNLFTSWMNGDMVFRNTSFENIVKKLERQYNVTIVNNNTALAKEHFNATIATKDEAIEQVLSYFNTLHEIHYSVVDNKIVIN